MCFCILFARAFLDVVLHAVAAGENKSAHAVIGSGANLRKVEDESENFSRTPAPLEPQCVDATVTRLLDSQCKRRGGSWAWRSSARGRTRGGSRRT